MQHTLHRLLVADLNSYDGAHGFYQFLSDGRLVVYCNHVKVLTSHLMRFTVPLAMTIAA